MASLQAIKRRRQSVTNTRQITKALELVSASKMRRAQEAALASRLYAERVAELEARVAAHPAAGDHPLFGARAVQARLYVVFTSDMGLAGAYNANITKLLLQRLEADQAADVRSQLIVIGRKGAQLAAKLEGIELVGVYENWPTKPTSATIAPILVQAREAFLAGTADEVVVLATEFKSMLSQEAAATRLLPLQRPQTVVTDTTLLGIYEPSPRAVLETLVPRLVETLLLQAAYEASASEQSMRMMAMKSASDNAASIIDDLTLAYNSARQAGITQELAEISAGAQAIS